ncbi:unnamed protein product, partial [marine sediment metagenome]
LSIDLAPTVLDLAGLKRSDAPKMNGRSLAPFLRGGNPKNWRKSFFIEYNTDTVFPRVYRMGYRAIRTNRWKLIHYLDLEGMDELYDLKRDPYELENRIDDPAVQATLENLRTQLNRIL